MKRPLLTAAMLALLVGSAWFLLSAYQHNAAAEAESALRQIVVNCTQLPPSPIPGAVTVDRADIERANLLLCRLDAAKAARR